MSLDGTAIAVEEGGNNNGEQDQVDIPWDVEQGNREWVGHPDARVLPEGLGVGLEGHGKVFDSVGGENDEFEGVGTSVAMVDIAEGGQSMGKGRVDRDDGWLDIGDNLDDGPEDLNKLGAEPGERDPQQEAHAPDGADEADACLVHVDPVGGDFGSEPSGYHVDARDGVEDDGAGKSLVTLGIFVCGEDILLDGWEGSEVDFNIFVWECEEGVTGG